MVHVAWSLGSIIVGVGKTLSLYRYWEGGLRTASDWGCFSVFRFEGGGAHYDSTKKYIFFEKKSRGAALRMRPQLIDVVLKALFLKPLQSFAYWICGCELHPHRLFLVAPCRFFPKASAKGSS